MVTFLTLLISFVMIQLSHGNDYDCFTYWTVYQAIKGAGQQGSIAGLFSKTTTSETSEIYHVPIFKSLEAAQNALTGGNKSVGQASGRLLEKASVGYMTFDFFGSGDEFQITIDNASTSFPGVVKRGNRSVQSIEAFRKNLEDMISQWTFCEEDDCVPNWTVDQGEGETFTGKIPKTTFETTEIYNIPIFDSLEAAQTGLNGKNKPVGRMFGKVQTQASVGWLIFDFFASGDEFQIIVDNELASLPGVFKRGNGSVQSINASREQLGDKISQWTFCELVDCVTYWTVNQAGEDESEYENFTGVMPTTTSYTMKTYNVPVFKSFEGAQNALTVGEKSIGRGSGKVLENYSVGFMTFDFFESGEKIQIAMDYASTSLPGVVLRGNGSVQSFEVVRQQLGDKISKWTFCY